MFMRLRLQALRSERGSELVEFALTSTLLMMVIFGIVNLGIVVWQYNMVANLAQEGARWASVRGAGSSSPASSSDVQTYVNTRSINMPVTVTATWSPNTSSGSTVTVQVSKSFNRFTAYVLPATITLTSTARMIVAR
jgi:Flp pilus assembly protein TadG